MKTKDIIELAQALSILHNLEVDRQSRRMEVYYTTDPYGPLILRVVDRIRELLSEEEKEEEEEEIASSLPENDAIPL